MTTGGGELKQLVRELVAMPPADRDQVIALLGDDHSRKLAPLLEEMTASTHSDDFLVLLRALDGDRRPKDITAAGAAAIRAASVTAAPARAFGAIEHGSMSMLARAARLVFGERAR